MNLANIMVSVDIGPAAADRVQLAASLPNRFEDELIGVAARQVSPPACSTSAYGHSRLREWMFGGVTRDVLQNTSVCCLMSN